MRLLLLSDTHGNLQCINDLASRARADLVVHAGDFGFYDCGSLDRLSDREIRLLVKYSSLPQEEKNRILKAAPAGMADAVREHRLLGSFQDFLDGREFFDVPVYAVWGNHEDIAVVNRLFRREIAVENLHILHHQKAHRIGPVFLYGLGGNLLPGPKMLQQPIAGGRGKIWSALSQYDDLVATAERDAGDAKYRVFVSHVSPGKEAFVEHIAARTGADYTVTGHMGAPVCMVWNSFTIRTVEEARQHLQGGLDAVFDACTRAGGKHQDEVAEMVRRISAMPDHMEEARMRGGEPRWYRGMTHVNLPDAEIGYAILNIDDASASLQSFVIQTPDQ